MSFCNWPITADWANAYRPSEPPYEGRYARRRIKLLNSPPARYLTELKNTVEIFKDSTVASRLKPSRIKHPLKTARLKTFAYHLVPLNTFPMPLG